MGAHIDPEPPISALLLAAVPVGLTAQARTFTFSDGRSQATLSSAQLDVLVYGRGFVNVVPLLVAEGKAVRTSTASFTDTATFTVGSADHAEMSQAGQDYTAQPATPTLQTSLTSLTATCTMSTSSLSAGTVSLSADDVDPDALPGVDWFPASTGRPTRPAAASSSARSCCPRPPGRCRSSVFG